MHVRTPCWQNSRMCTVGEANSESKEEKSYQMRDFSGCTRSSRRSTHAGCAQPGAAQRSRLEVLTSVAKRKINTKAVRLALWRVLFSTMFSQCCLVSSTPATQRPAIRETRNHLSLRLCPATPLLVAQDAFSPPTPGNRRCASQTGIWIAWVIDVRSVHPHSAFRDALPICSSVFSGRRSSPSNCAYVKPSHEVPLNSSVYAAR
jgi:hypothetical protein